MSVWSDMRLAMMLDETPDTMREKLRQFRDLDPEAYCEHSRGVLPADALPSDALSDRQLERISDAMLKGIARIARRDRGSAKVH
jgi:hypothetical protein